MKNYNNILVLDDILEKEIIKAISDYYHSGKCTSHGFDKYPDVYKSAKLEIKDGHLFVDFPASDDSKWNSIFKIDSISFIKRQLNGMYQWPDIARIILEVIRNHRIDIILT
jgi:hypothetical protein